MMVTSRPFPPRSWIMILPSRYRTLFTPAKLFGTLVKNAVYRRVALSPASRYTNVGLPKICGLVVRTVNG